MPREADRRLLALGIDEVSLVDAPANEVEFLVTKNQEDQEMGAKAEVKKDAADEVVSVAVETQGTVSDSVAKSLEHVNAMVTKITELAVAKSDSGDSEPVAKSDSAKEDSKEAAPAPDLSEVLKSIGVTDDKMEAATAALQKAMQDPEQEEVSAENTPVTPSMILKAAAMTPGRIEKISEAIETLKLVLEGIATGQSPATRTPGVGTHPNPSPVNEMASPQTDPVVKSQEQIVKALESVSERLEAIEKARPGSNSVEEVADGTDTNVKKADHIWTGVL